jgi:hypothetical protein
MDPDESPIYAFSFSFLKSNKTASKQQTFILLSEAAL